MNYKQYMENSSLTEEAKERILSRLEEAGRKTEQKRLSPAWKGAIAVGATLALACVAIPVGLSLSAKDRAVSGDLISGNSIMSDLGFGGGALGREEGTESSAPQIFSPLYCGYLFQTDVYEKSEVKATLLFGIDEEQFSCLAEQEFGRRGEMVEFSLVVGVYNYDVRGNDSFDGATEGDYADGAQIYYAETVSDYSKLDLAEYAVDLETKETGEGIVCGNKTYYVSYSKQLEVSVPEELFAGTSGRIDFFFYNYIKYADGTEGFYAHSYNEGPPCFFYRVEGDRVRLSQNG